MIEWYWVLVAGVAGTVIGACSCTVVTLWAIKAGV